MGMLLSMDSFLIKVTQLYYKMQALLTGVENYIFVVGVGKKQGNQITLCDVALAQSEESGSIFRVVASEESLQILQAFCEGSFLSLFHSNDIVEQAAVAQGCPAPSCNIQRSDVRGRKGMAIPMQSSVLQYTAFSFLSRIHPPSPAEHDMRSS